jgi:ABC-type glycerol-3-phosphate transport system substrate-binding protein
LEEEMKFLLTVALAALFASAVFAGGANDQAGSSGGKKTVRVQFIGTYQLQDFTDTTTGKTNKGFHFLEEEFERLHPDIDVQFVFMPWDDYEKKTQAMMLANECDVYQVPALAVLADQNLLEPLEPYIQRDKFDLNIFLDGQVEGWKVAGPKDTEHRIYSLPLLGDSRFIMYDKKIFDDWGVPYLSKNPTVEEVMEKAAKMTGKNPKTGEQNYGFAWRGMDSDDTLTNLCEYYGGQWGSGLRNKELKMEFNSPQYVKAAQTLKQMLPYAPVGVMSGSGTEAWGTEKNVIAMHIRARPVDVRNVQLLGLESRYGSSIQFLSPKTRTGNLFVGSPSAIGASSKVKDAAWEWIKFTASDFFAEFLWNNTMDLPTVKHAFDLQGVRSNDNYTTLFQSMSSLWGPRYLYRAVKRNVLVAAIEDIINNNADIQTRLNQAQAEMETWIKQL